jgi:hypothetical protein
VQSDLEMGFMGLPSKSEMLSDIEATWNKYRSMQIHYSEPQRLKKFRILT